MLLSHVHDIPEKKWTKLHKQIKAESYVIKNNFIT